MAKRTVNRCIVCGRPLNESRSVYRISKGHKIKGKWKELEIYGTMHQSCFAKMAESPKIVIDELKRQARVEDSEAA